MQIVKNYTYKKLIDELLGKMVHFKSDCDLFPNFDFTGKVLSYYFTQSELILKVRKRYSIKQIDIGSNMKNLRFEIINDNKG